MAETVARIHLTKITRLQFNQVFPPPPVQGIGNAGGLKLHVQDRRAAGLPALQANTDELIAKALQEPGMAAAFTSFRSQAPQLYLDIDRRKAETLGVPISSIFDTLQAYLGSTYVNDFNFLNRVYQVNIQGENAFRLQPDSICSLYTRNENNEMVPLGTLLNITETNGPDKVMHYNLYPSADVNAVSQPGFSSGQAGGPDGTAGRCLAPAVRLRVDRNGAATETGR